MPDFGPDNPRELTLVTDTFTEDLPMPPDLGITYSPLSIVVVTGRRHPADWSVIDHIRLVGDPRLYVDFFDETFKPDVTAGTFVRMGWPFGPGITPRLTMDPDAAAFALEIEGQHGPWTSFRIYDRGECSASRSWEEVGAGIASGLAEGLEGGDLGLRSVRYDITPVLRDLLDLGTERDTQDLFVMHQVFVGNCSGLLDISFRGGFTSDGTGAMVFGLDRVGPVTMDFRQDACAGLLAVAAGLGFDAGALERQVVATVTEELEAQLEPRLTQGLRVALAQALVRNLRCTDPPGPSDSCVNFVRRGLGAFGVARTAVTTAQAECVPDESDGNSYCRFVPPVQRLHTGPLGLEVVLADSTGDPFYPAYRNADSVMGTALCDRGPQPYALAGGSFGTVGPAPGPWVPGGGGCAAAPGSVRGLAVAMLLGALACWAIRRRR